jgi:hypothetical protein
MVNRVNGFATTTMIASAGAGRAAERSGGYNASRDVWLTRDQWEDSMKWISGYAALAVILLLASTARSDLLISSLQYNSGGYNHQMYFARNDGSNGSGTRVVGVDVTVDDTINVPLLVIKFVNDSATAEADLTGSALYRDSGDDLTALFHSDRSFVNLIGDWNGDSDPAAFITTTTNPSNAHANFVNGVSQFEVSGVVPGGVDATTASNYGFGALFAVAVSPWDRPTYRAPGDVRGSLTTDTGVIEPINVFQDSQPITEPVPPFPEPAGVAVIGAVLLLGRRRLGMTRRR